VPVFDRSQSIVNSVKDVQFTLVIAFVLVVMVIYVFLGRATDTLIPAVALPLSLLLTVAVMYTLNYSIKQFDVDGAHARDRISGRRCDCLSRKRRSFAPSMANRS